MAETPDTDHFGFTRVGEGETLSKNGFAALDLDRITLDDLLHALVEHSHDNQPRLPDPAGTPSLIGRPSGGTLPPGTTLYYRVSYVDRWGLETAASSEASVTTPAPLAPPQAIAINLETSSGTLGPGLYAYVATFVTPSGGETTPGPRSEIRIPSGTTNRFRMDLPDRIPGATGIRVYRSKPGQTQYYFLFETDQDILYDDGIQEDPTITSPGFNNTNANNSVEVTVPGAVLPPGVFGWKLYRSTQPGTYAGFNLVHTVVEGTTSSTGEDIRVSWVDAGDALQRGEPKQVSSTVGSGKPINLSTLQGRFPLSAVPRGVRSWDVFVPGSVKMGTTYSQFRSPYPISPTQIAAFFQTPPVTDPAGAQVSFRVEDSTGLSIPLSTDGSNGKFYVTTLPITDEGVFEAEKGERPVNSFVPILTDLKASNGQACELNAVGEYVQINVGILDKGEYEASAWVRATLSGAPIQGDVVVTALLGGSTPIVLGRQEFAVAPLDNGDYRVIGPVQFRAPGGVPVLLRVHKGTNEPGIYLVDRIRYAARLRNLAAGDIRLIADVGDLPDQEYPRPVPPADVHIAFDQTHAIVRPRGATPSGTATLTARSSGGAPISMIVSSNQPWLTVTPTVANASTLTITATVDFTSLNPGTRTLGTITVSEGATTPTHLSGSVTVVALAPPTNTGGDVNLTVHY